MIYKGKMTNIFWFLLFKFEDFAAFLCFGLTVGETKQDITLGFGKL